MAGLPPGSVSDRLSLVTDSPALTARTDRQIRVLTEQLRVQLQTTEAVTCRRDACRLRRRPPAQDDVHAERVLGAARRAGRSGGGGGVSSGGRRRVSAPQQSRQRVQSAREAGQRRVQVRVCEEERRCRRRRRGGPVRGQTGRRGGGRAAG